MWKIMWVWIWGGGWWGRLLRSRVPSSCFVVLFRWNETTVWWWLQWWGLLLLLLLLFGLLFVGEAERKIERTVKRKKKLESGKNVSQVQEKWTKWTEERQSAAAAAPLLFWLMLSSAACKRWWGGEGRKMRREMLKCSLSFILLSSLFLVAHFILSALLLNTVWTTTRTKRETEKDSNVWMNE